MDTEAAAVLVAAAGAGNLSAAARRLGIAPMIATRRLAALERDLGVRLMHRTTRSVSLTPEGEMFLPYAQALVEGEAAARASLRPATSGVSGLLRITASAAFGRKVITPIIPGLLRDNPDLRIDLELEDRIVDIVATGADLALRIGVLRDNSLVAQRLAPNVRVLCAAPAYLAARGRPRTVEDLARHDCLNVTGATHWPLQVDGKERRVRVNSRFTASNVDAILTACIDGAGLGLFSDWNVRGELASGVLVPVPLDRVNLERHWIWAVYPTTRQVLPKLRLFIATLQATLERL